MKVGELARLCEVPPDVVRYYARIGLLKPRRDAENGYRHFCAADASRLRVIRLSKDIGLSLKDVRAVLDAVEAGECVGDVMTRALQRRLSGAHEHLRQLSHAVACMEEGLSLIRQKGFRLDDLSVLHEFLCDITRGRAGIRG